MSTDVLKGSSVSPWAPLHHKIPDAVDRFDCLKYQFLDARGRCRLAHDLAHIEPLMVALVQAATTAPVFLLALLAGALVDIVDRRRYLITAQVWMMMAAATLGALTLQE